MRIPLLLLCLFLLSACSLAAPLFTPTPTTPVAPAFSAAITATTAPPTASSFPSLTPSATASPTPSPTATATLHPMAILAQRQTPYPGSPITIERTLEPGANYQRYYAYYLSEGLKIYALLTVPNGERPAGGWPAIVFNHGYIPPTQYRTTERYIAYVDNLARNGYIVFRIDYRGHDRSEGAARGGYGDPGYLIDVLNAVSALRQYPEANPEKIGMWGHSMGGYLTLRAMVLSPEIKVGVIWAGVVASYSDLLNNWRRSGASASHPIPTVARGWRANWVEQYGSPEDNPEFWSSLSANSYLADLSGPLQLHHGSADEDVPWEFSQSLYDQAVAAGQEIEFYIYPGDNHNLSGFFSTAMARTIAFYDKYLK